MVNMWEIDLLELKKEKKGSIISAYEDDNDNYTKNWADEF